jgi:hypothetical protein
MTFRSSSLLLASLLLGLSLAACSEDPSSDLPDASVDSSADGSVSSDASLPADAGAEPDAGTADSGLPDPNDHTPPTVVSTQPKQDDADVPLDSKIRITFSEPIDPASITADSFELIESWYGEPQGDPLPGTWDASANPLIVFTPDQWFGVGDELTFTVRAGIKDLAGNAMTADHSFYFDAAWTNPGNAPTVVSTLPANGATAVSTSTAISVTFSKPMHPSTVTAPATIKLYEGSNPAGAIAMTQSDSANTTFVFYPEATLDPDTRYTLLIKGGSEGVKDAADNAMSADFEAAFTTGSGADSGALQVVSITPSSGATGVQQNAAVEVTFNKPVDPSKVFLSYPGTTGTFRVSRYADASFPEAGTLGFSANPTVRFEIDPETTYELERTYTVKITGGAQGVRALSGATMAADYVSTFTVKGPDVPDGTIDDLRAADGLCAIRVRGVYMTFFRDQPSNRKGFFIQKDRNGPAIFVMTGGTNPLFPIYPAGTGYPNIDISVTKVGENEGFKQVLAFSMTRNVEATVQLPFIKDNLVQVIGDEALGADRESEYLQIDGTLANYRPGASMENREFDLLYGTDKRVTLKVNQDGIMNPLGLANGVRVRVLAPLQRDENGFFIKPYGFWDEQTPMMTPEQLDDPANYDYLLDIIKLGP